MNTYTYKIDNLLRDAADIVVTASFSVTASDGVDSFTHTYNTGFSPPVDTPIPFDELTEEIVVGWITASVGQRIEEQADAELAAFKARKVVQSGVPW